MVVIVVKDGIILLGKVVSCPIIMQSHIQMGALSGNFSGDVSPGILTGGK